MGAMPVVHVQPIRQLGGALVRILISTGIGPFVQRGLDQSYGLTVGSRPIRPRAAMTDAQPATRLGEDVRFW